MRRSSSRLRYAAALLSLAGALIVTALPATGELTLELTSPKTYYLLDEPLFVTVTVRNVGPHDAQILRLFHLGAGIVGFEITAPGERVHLYQPWVTFQMTREGLARTAIWLEPGEAYSATADLTYEIRDSARVTLLSSPGEYVLRAIYAIREDWPAGPVALRSNEVSLVVLEPGGVDGLAHVVLRDGAMSDERGLWNAATKQAACYEMLLREFPDSAYALYTRFYLAQVYESDGQEELRGTADGAAALEMAAGLYLSVAEETGHTPLGVYAMRLAGRGFAQLGEVATAQALFEQCFLSPGATDADKLEALSWMGHLEKGMFRQSGGLVSASAATQLRLPLRRFAKALGFAVGWDAATKTVSIRGSKVLSTLQPGNPRMMVNGNERTGVTVSLEDGRTRVSLSVIATLMAEQRGKGIENALSNLLARAPHARQEHTRRGS